MNTHYNGENQFSYLADNWWDTRGELKTLHAINPVRLRYTHDCVDLTNKRVLDVGCGGGIFSEAMAKKSARVTGIDISEEVINTARTHAAREKLDIKYQKSTIEQWSKSNQEKYDVITCMELLEHVPSPPDIIASMSKLIAPGGDIVLSTINRTTRAYLKTIIIAEHLINLIPKKTHQYSQYIRPSELAKWLRDEDFEIVDVSGMTYIPVINYVALTDNISVNYLVHARFQG